MLDTSDTIILDVDNCLSESIENWLPGYLIDTTPSVYNYNHTFQDDRKYIWFLKDYNKIPSIKWSILNSIKTPLNSIFCVLCINKSRSFKLLIMNDFSLKLHNSCCNCFNFFFSVKTKCMSEDW